MILKGKLLFNDCCLAGNYCVHSNVSCDWLICFFLVVGSCLLVTKEQKHPQEIMRNKPRTEVKGRAAELWPLHSPGPVCLLSEPPDTETWTGFRYLYGSFCRFSEIICKVFLLTLLLVCCVNIILFSGVWLWNPERPSGKRCYQRLWLLLPVPAALPGPCGDVRCSLSSTALSHMHTQSQVMIYGFIVCNKEHRKQRRSDTVHPEHIEPLRQKFNSLLWHQ